MKTSNRNFCQPSWQLDVVLWVQSRWTVNVFHREPMNLFSNGKKIWLNIGLVTNIALKKHQYKESNLSSAHSLSLVFSLILSSREVVVVVHGDVVWCFSSVSSSEHGAPLSPLLHGWRAEHSSDGLIKYRLQASLGQRRALQVLHSPWGRKRAWWGKRRLSDTQQHRF